MLLRLEETQVRGGGEVRGSERTGRMWISQHCDGEQDVGLMHLSASGSFRGFAPLFSL